MWILTNHKKVRQQLYNFVYKVGQFTDRGGQNGWIYPE